MDELDRRIVNALQGGFPVSPRPFEEAARQLGTDEATLIARLRRLLEQGVLTRFGPLFNAERLGGAFTLCAMAVPRQDFERVAAIVNSFPEVAHNYEREHRYNLWFVVAATDTARLRQAVAAIETRTGYSVLDLPKLDEYFLDLRLAA
ncbi:MAG: AsnC family transcriptional regulator [Pseudomonadota bacterium]